MASNVDDRRRAAYEQATTLSQAMLDETFRGGNNQIETIGTLVKINTAAVTIDIVTSTLTSAGHGLANGNIVFLFTTGALPTGLSSLTDYYVVTATTDTFQLAATSGGAAIGLSGGQSGTHTWTRNITLRFADRPKFVGDDFYEGRAEFPDVKRTIGDPQSPSIQFSQIEVGLANMDGFYNTYLEGGDDYFSPIGARLTVMIGLRDVMGSFQTIFDGFVPEEDGFDVQREKITVRATDRFNELNKPSPLPSINSTDFPSAPQDTLGKIIPLVLGDWEAGFNITDDTGTVDIQDGGLTKVVRTASPVGFYGGTIGYYVGGGFFVFSIGTYTPDTIAACYVKRGDTVFMVNFTPTPDNTAGYWSVEVTSHKVSGGGTATYIYQSGDVAVISVKVPYAVAKYSNVIEIAQELLYTLGGRVSGDLEPTSWAALAAKSTPAQSAFTSIKGRIWVGETSESVLSIVLGLLEEVRVEMFIDSAGLIKVTTLHPEDFVAPASATRIDQTEVDELTAQTKADDKTFFNQAYLNYAFTPITGKTGLATGQLANEQSVRLSGKRVIKVIDCGSLYVDTDAVNQLTEFVRFYSMGIIFLEVGLCWVHLLRDLGEFVAFNYDVGSLSLSESPAIVRDIKVDPDTGAVNVRLLMLTNFPYTGYAPSNAAKMLSSASQAITSA